MANIDMNMLSKGVETVMNISKVASNLSEKKTVVTEEPRYLKEGDTATNQPHTQTVEVKVGEAVSQPAKPYVLKEKHETHIHKAFPEGRELSERECEVEKLRLEYEQEFRLKELNHRIEQETIERNERREREEYARKELERRREENRRFSRNATIVAGIFGTALLGGLGYSIYRDSRNDRISRYSLPKPAGAVTLNGEGTVK